MITRLAIELLRIPRTALNRKAMAPGTVSSIALIELTGLGDVIAMLPVLRALQKPFPTAELHLVVDDNYVELLRSFQLPAAIHGVIKSKSPGGTIAAIKLVRDLHATLACSMSPPRRNALVALASQSPCVAGYLRYRDSLTPYLLETPVEVFGLPSMQEVKYGRNHIAERALMVCRALGYSDDFPAVNLSVAAPVKADVRAVLQNAGLLPAGGYVVVHPFAGWKYREWPLSAFATLARRLVETGNTRVVFLWEEEREGDLALLRRQFSGNRFVLFASTLSLLGSAVLISGASLFVGNDSGPLHLAAALGVPSVGLFGPSDPLLTAPRSLPHGLWLYRKVDCSPCDQRKCVKPAGPCMNNITVEEVLESAISVQRRASHA